MGRLDVPQVPERGGRGQLRKAADLLRRSALQVSADEQRTSGRTAQLGRERGDRLAVAAEQDEAAHAGRERRVDLGVLVREAAVRGPRAQRGEDQPRERRAHAGVTWPSTRGPRAPVAPGRFPASPRNVR